MNNRVKNIARVSPLEDAQALWDALNGVGIATEEYMRATLVESHEPRDASKETFALHNLARAVHDTKTRFAKITGWFPVSVYTERLQEGVAGQLFSQELLDQALGGAVHFDVMVEAFTFRHPELKQQAVEQAYQELLASAPLFSQMGQWAEDTLRRACADAIARLYGSAAVADALST
jgi:hypothetical protein